MLHPDKFQVKLMEEGCGLPVVIESPRLHPGGCQTAQVWIKEVSQCRPGIPAFLTEAAHEPSYGFRRERTHVHPNLKCKEF